MDKCDSCRHTHEPKEKPQTEGQAWAKDMTRGIGEDCPAVQLDSGGEITCGDVDCRLCGPRLAVAFDLGQASVKPEPAEESEFQKIVREVLSFAPDVPWETIETCHPVALRNLRKSFNTALGLAEGIAREQCPFTTDTADDIAALKAPEKG